MATRSCAGCGDKKAMVRFENRRFTVEHEGLRKTVDGLSGWRCKACDEIEFDVESARRYAAAGDALVIEARKRQQKELKRIRQKLNLSQHAAARLTGGGHNAFSRYERGSAQPLPAVVNLFRLLDRHPELLREIAPNEVPQPRRQLNSTVSQRLPIADQLKLASGVAVSARVFFDVWWTFRGKVTRPKIIDTMNLYSEYFRADHRAYFYALVVHSASLFDDDDSTASFSSLLKHSQSTASSRRKVIEAEELFDVLKPIGRRLYRLRNKCFAHLDARVREEDIFGEVRLTPDDLNLLTRKSIVLANKLLAANELPENHENNYAKAQLEKMLADLKVYHSSSWQVLQPHPEFLTVKVTR